MGQSYDLEMERRRLRKEAYRLRQEAIRDGDYEVWQIARLLRDARAAKAEGKIVPNEITEDHA